MTVKSSATARFVCAVARFDQANGEDPNRERVADVQRPTAMVYAERMSACLDKLAPDAPEAVRLAARCQHIRRWMIPRREYPMGRDGYRRWRTDLAQFHAETAAEILHEVEYDAAMIARVQVLLRKERLKADPGVQLLEDVICLVFIEHYLDAFSRQHDRPKVIDIIRKTWRKMSDRGREAAVALAFTPHVRSLLRDAVEAV